MLSEIIVPLTGLFAILLAVLQVTASPVELERRDSKTYTAAIMKGYTVHPCPNIGAGYRVGLGASTFPNAKW